MIERHQNEWLGLKFTAKFSENLMVYITTHLEYLLDLQLL